jgi:hypothetical protein
MGGNFKASLGKLIADADQEERPIPDQCDGSSLKSYEGFF